jgi:hypothetical protein
VTVMTPSACSQEGDRVGPLEPQSKDWFKSTYCTGSGPCVEVRFDPGGTASIRDSKYREDPSNDLAAQPVIIVPISAWNSFLGDVVNHTPAGTNSFLYTEHATDGSVIVRSIDGATALSYDAVEWAAFVDGVTANEFHPELSPA